MEENRWYEIVGKRIEERLIQKYDSLKDAGLKLDISQTELSKIISGARKPNTERTLKFIAIGIDKEYFDLYYHLEKIEVDKLTTREIIKLYESQQFLILQQQNMIKFLMKRLDKFT